MLGEDDWFEKTTATGRDYGRYRYMGQLLAFNEARKQAILADDEPASVPRPSRPKAVAAE
jgi:hypothetical protein